MRTYSGNPKLSILTPTIPGRESQAKALSLKLSRLIGNAPVEHLILSDNRKRSIGAKRQALVDIARGDYIAFVDDDDDVKPKYIEKLLQAIEQGADVITFKQEAIYNDQRSTVIFRAGYPDGPFINGGTTIRGPWHVCAWRRKAVEGCLFGESNYGEDRVWSLQARERIRTSTHIDNVLHKYHHDAETTAAPEGQ